MSRDVALILIGWLSAVFSFVLAQVGALLRQRRRIRRAEERKQGDDRG